MLQQGHRTQRLGTGEDVDQGVLFPDPAVVLVHHPGPDIQHSGIPHGHAQRRPPGLRVALLLGKEFAHGFEAGVEIALYLGHLIGSCPINGLAWVVPVRVR